MRILAIPGSLRSGSFNRNLLENARRALHGKAEVEFYDLRRPDLPIYDGDLEKKDGLPVGARQLKESLAAADALMIGTPEYNNSIPGGLKNAIDWASRPPANPFKGKVTLIMGATVGQYGALRGILAVRQILTALMAVVVPSTVMISNADQAFDDAGLLKDPRSRTHVERACAELVRFATALRT